MDQKEIGALIRREREKLGYTQEDIAEKLGIKRNTYSAYESGKIAISAEKLILLFEIINMDTGQFFDFKSRYSDLIKKIIELIKESDNFKNIEIINKEEDMLREYLNLLLKYTEINGKLKT